VSIGLRITIGIATRGRPAVLAETLSLIARQTLQPDRILICHVDPSDIEGIVPSISVEYLQSSAGSAHQRNVLLDAAGDCDVMLFLDDDFFPAPRYVEMVSDIFSIHQDIVVATGTVIADGATGPGLSCEAARRILAGDIYRGNWPGLAATWGGYGCNMAIRMTTVRYNGIRFDERLPLYGWWEDIDFTRRLGAHGQIVRVGAARGVHLGAKGGRTSGVRLGYSQVANPFYMARKGSVSWHAAVRKAGSNVLMNVARFAWPESYVDRRGRLRGNVIAFRDWLLGRLNPENIIEL
jgi:GT2 family glycosyltransferase